MTERFATDLHRGQSTGRQPSSREELMKHPGRTMPFLEPGGQPVPATASRRSGHPLWLRGIDQWVMIRGESLRSPLILLHGGPAMSEMSFLALQCAAEKSFTVVNWDQRGAGKIDPTAGSTLSSMTASSSSLLRSSTSQSMPVCKRTRVRTRSQSSDIPAPALECCMPTCFPEKVAAYVGSGTYLATGWRRSCHPMPLRSPKLSV